MGCGCSTGTGHGIANFVFMFERFGSTIAILMIVTCMIITTVGMLALGVGLGYNYCFVDFKVKRLFDEGKQPRRAMARRRRGAADESEEFMGYKDEMQEIHVEPDMIVPLRTNMSYFTDLISRIKEMNMNVTLHLVAT